MNANKEKHIIHSLMLSRALLAIIGRLFYAPPDDITISALKDESFLRCLIYVNPKKANKWRNKLQNFLKYSNVKEQLALLYSKLFSVPGKNNIKLYESYYKDVWYIPSNIKQIPAPEMQQTIAGIKNLIYGETTVNIKKLYASEDIKLNDDFHELPDHLACEVHFLQYLISKQIDAIEQSKFTMTENYANKILDFIEEHLKSFVNSIRSEFRKFRINNLYSTILEILIDVFVIITEVERNLIRKNSISIGGLYVQVH
jgi:TorA maturation chaperone TorD